MDDARWIDTLPLWTILPAVAIATLGAIAAGAWAGHRYIRGNDEQTRSAIAVLSGALIGMLAFIFAFTFNMAASRFDVRKDLLLAEVNAIETAYLRSGVAPEPYQKAAQELLKEYLSVRIELLEGLATVDDAVQAAESIQSDLWQVSLEMVRAGHDSPSTALFMASLNEMFDLQTMRIFYGVQFYIPSAIWMTLGGITLAGMFHVGLSLPRVSVPGVLSVVSLSLVFAIMIALIVDLDRPTGLVQFSQQPLLDLVARLDRDAAPPPRL